MGYHTCPQSQQGCSTMARQGPGMPCVDGLIGMSTEQFGMEDLFDCMKHLSREGPCREHQDLQTEFRAKAAGPLGGQ